MHYQSEFQCDPFQDRRAEFLDSAAEFLDSRCPVAAAVRRWHPPRLAHLAHLNLNLASRVVCYSIEIDTDTYY